jgi:carboxymethylenebutenolidase
LRSLCDWFARRGFVAACRVAGERAAIGIRDAVAAIVNLLRHDPRTLGQIAVLVIGNDALANDARTCRADLWVWFRDDASAIARDWWKGLNGPALVHGVRSSAMHALDIDVEVYEYEQVPKVLTQTASGRVGDDVEVALLRTSDFLCRRVVLQRIEAIAIEHVSRLATRRTAAAEAMLHDEGHIQCVPLAAGASGREALHEFYAQRLAAYVPPDLTRTLISRTVAGDRMVEESVLGFTHSRPIEWMLPGVPPTGKRIDVPIVTIMRVKDAKIAEQRMYWDQASVLVQAGLLADAGLPIAGASVAQEILRRTGTVPAADASLERRGGQLVVKGYQHYQIDTQSGRVVALDPALKGKCAALETALPLELVAGRSVLDLGASSGFYSLWLLSRGARQATAIDLNGACLRVMGEIQKELRAGTLHVKRDDALVCREQADIVLALGLIHWACAQRSGQSLETFVARLADAARERLIVEWVDPCDPSVAKLLDHDRGHYRRDLFEQALTRHFASHWLAQFIAPTRQLYVATRRSA